MGKRLAVFSIVVALVIAAGSIGYALWVQHKTVCEECEECDEYTQCPEEVTFYYVSPKGIVLILKDLTPNTQILSDTTLSGKVTGNWFFEGSFPVTVTDADGNTLGTSIATSSEDWMQAGDITFTTTLSFASGDNTKGFLVLAKDNPSDLPENDDQIRISVTF